LSTEAESARNELLYLALLRVIATHEFLHAAGMDHHQGPGMMNGGPNADAEFTTEDRAACFEQGACD
jgi:hypothetical protein